LIFFIAAKGDRKNGDCVPRLFKRVIAYKFAPMREDHSVRGAAGYELSFRGDESEKAA
jgi:hypothetical protein